MPSTRRGLSMVMICTIVEVILGWGAGSSICAAQSELPKVSGLPEINPARAAVTLPNWFPR